MIRSTSRSLVYEDPDLGNRQNILSEDLEGNKLAKGYVTVVLMLKTPIIPGLMSLKTQKMGIG